MLALIEVGVSGQHFDPQIVEAFLLKVSEMTEVQQQFVDVS